VLEVDVEKACHYFKKHFYFIFYHYSMVVVVETFSLFAQDDVGVFVMCVDFVALFLIVRFRMRRNDSDSVGLALPCICSLIRVEGMGDDEMG